jgi:hypothetical protein
VGLGIVQVLQAVFQIAQEGVGSQQLVDDGVAQQAFLGNDAQRGAGRAVAQRGVAAAADQLEHLRQELDFADAAAAQLDVVAAVRVQPLLAVDLGADLACILRMASITPKSR